MAYTSNRGFEKMASAISRSRSKSLLVTMLFFHCITCTTVFFNVPVARQVIGFAYLTFIPGYLVVKLLRLNMSDKLETFLFSTGLSVAILMLIGFLINLLGPLLAISGPLSLLSLTIVISFFSLTCVLLVYLKGEDVNVWSGGLPEGSRFSLLFVCLPILSIVGAIWLTSYGNNSMALLVILAISVLFAVGVAYKKLLPSKLYPFAILTFAIAILYHSSLVSKYIVTFGSDIHIEYFLFEKTLTSAHWSSTLPFFWDVGWGRVNAMLSVTVLPTAYSIFLNVDPTWVVKAIIPLIFSFVPLGLYTMWQKYIDKRFALIAAFLFIAEATFYSEILALVRQMVAEFFFVLLLLLISDDKMKSNTSKVICFVILSFGLVTSHYSIAELFLFFIFAVLVSLIILKRSSRKITASMVVLFLVIMFAWYVFTSNSAVFDSLMGFGQNLYNQLGSFLNPASRGQEVLRALGMEASPSIWNTLSRASAYAVEALIALGFIGLFSERVRLTGLRIDKESFGFIVVAMAFLAGFVLVPGLANALGAARFYHILLFFLAPLSVLGAGAFARLVFRRKSDLAISLVLLIVIVTYFLFQTGFAYEIAKNDTYSFQVSLQRMSPLRLYLASGYIDVYSVFGAQWSSRNLNVPDTPIYADSISQPMLDTYGSIYTGYVSVLSNTTSVVANSIVYLSALNVVYETAVLGDRSYNSSELSPQLDYLNSIYSNGGSQIFKNPQG